MKISRILALDTATEATITLFRVGVSAGKPSTAGECPGERVNFHRLLVKNPATTYAVTVAGESMTGDGINDGDTLIVDRSLEAVPGDVVVVQVGADYAVKRLSQVGGRLWLVPSNTKFKPLRIEEEPPCEVWGVVTHVIHRV